MMTRRADSIQNNKGSILVVAMIFGLLMLATAGILLNYGSSEKLINERHFMRLEAQAAAESTVEYGFAHLQNRWLHRTNFQSDELRTDPVTLPSSKDRFFANSNVDITSFELSGGKVSSGQWIYIHPKDPANILDPQKSKRIFARDVTLYGKATVNPYDGSRNKDPVTAYCAQVLQVRDAPSSPTPSFITWTWNFSPYPSWTFMVQSTEIQIFMCKR